MKAQYRRTLNFQLFWKYAFCGVLLFALEFALYIYATSTKVENSISIVALSIIIAIGVFIFGFAYTKQVRTDIQGGEIAYYEKEIEEKTEHVVIENWIYRIQGKKPITKYFFHSKGVSYQVNEQLYKNREVGDKFLVPYAPASKIEFNVEK